MSSKRFNLNRAKIFKFTKVFELKSDDLLFFLAPHFENGTKTFTFIGAVAFYTFQMENERHFRVLPLSNNKR